MKQSVKMIVDSTTPIGEKKHILILPIYNGEEEKCNQIKYSIGHKLAGIALHIKLKII